MGQPDIIHVFDDKNDFSHSAEAFWDTIYHKFFPDMVGYVDNNDNNLAQRLGIDRVIVLKTGHTLRIDEKLRNRLFNDENPDILLEHVSNSNTGSDGWIKKDLQIDYIAYAWLPSARCIMLPWPPLKRAWMRNSQDWLNRYKICSAPNANYNTLNVAVPFDVLRQAIIDACCIAA